VIYFSLDPESTVIQEHCLNGTAGINGVKGKRAVIVREGEIFLVTGFSELSLCKLADIPLAGGRTIYEAENVLAAVGAAWALDIEPALIRTGITLLRTGIENFSGI
jgi:cyanophycin synthetase